MSSPFWLRAYPRRWREERGAELLAVVEDTGGASGTQALALVLAGWGARWRMRPPLHTVAAYRMFGRRPAARHDGWLRDDVEGLWFPVRDELWTFVAVLALLSFVRPLWPDDGRAATVGITVIFAGNVWRSARGRGATRARLFGPSPETQLGPWRPYQPRAGLDG